MPMSKAFNTNNLLQGSGGTQVVSVLAFHSGDLSWNPAEVYRFNSVKCMKRTKINKKRPGLANFNEKNIPAQ